METEEQPRNDAGQFTSGETLTGLAGVERDAGYTPFSTLSQADAIDGDPESLRAAFDDAVVRGVDVGDPDFEPDQIVLQDSDGKPLPENVTVTAEQAGAALSGYQHQIGSYVEGMELAAFTDQIDQARAAVLKNDPGAADQYGLDPAEVAANAAKLNQTAEQTEAVKPDPVDEKPSEINDAAQNDLPDANGLTAEDRQYLAKPHVRAQLEREFSEAIEAKQAYNNGVDALNRY